MKPGDIISRNYITAKKNLCTAKNGSPYLDLVLQDKSGTISAKIWSDSKAMQASFDINDVVAVEAIVESFNNTQQLNIKNLRTLRKEEVNKSEFVPSIQGDIGALENELKGYIACMENPYLKALLEKIFTNSEIYELFKTVPAARAIHHVYLGGLMDHTLSIARSCIMICRNYPDLDRDLLVAGALLHDIGKIYELGAGPVFEYTDEGRLIGHIVQGAALVQQAVDAIKDMPKSLAFKIMNMIVSHHGLREWGSPMPPKTIEGIVLHFLDDMDAKIYMAREAIKQAAASGKEWTEFHKTLQRELYAK